MPINFNEIKSKYLVDITVEIPVSDAYTMDEALDIGQELVDLLEEQDENKYYNIRLTKIKENING